jgi:potassium voltage-gated channel Eag-related subfamily H protein 7
VVDSEKLSKLRLLRVLRLVKLLRIVRASRVLERWEFQLGILHNTLLSYKLGFGLIFVNHWLACWWSMVPFLQVGEGIYYSSKI